MDMSDPVVWGSALTVIICVVIVGFLAVKVGKLINKDAESHRK